MKHLKLFENYNMTDARDLADQLEEDYIDDYFKDHYNIDSDEVHHYVDIWQFVDDERFVSDFISDYINNDSIDDIGTDKDEYKQYIKRKLLKDEDVKKYLDKKLRKKKLEPTTTYEEILDELDEDQLKKIIVDIAKEEYDFIQYYYENLYANRDAYDILEEIYGKKDLEENGYKYVENYLNDNDMIEWYYDNEDFDFKKNFVSEQIEWDEKLQTKLLNLKPENVILLFDIIDAGKNTIGGKYDFQKAYMEQIERMKEEDEEDDLFIAKKLKELNDKFRLDREIEKEYKDYTFYIDTEKYNL